MCQHTKLQVKLLFINKQYSLLGLDDIDQELYLDIFQPKWGFRYIPRDFSSQKGIGKKEIPNLS